MENLQKQELGQSHKHWLAWVTERSIRKNTVRKPPFDATKDITEKDMVRNRYMGMVAAAIYHEQSNINNLERKIARKAKFERIRDISILLIGLSMWIASGIYTVCYFLK